MKAYAIFISSPCIVLHAMLHSQSCRLHKQPCCYSGRLFSSLFGSHDHHPQAGSPRSHGEQPVSSPAAESGSHHTQAVATGTRSVVADMGRSRQQGSEGVGNNESMAGTDADLHTARQAQREALQAEQESLSDSHQSLMQVRESLQRQQPSTFLTVAITQAVCSVWVLVCLPFSLLLSWSELLAA